LAISDGILGTDDDSDPVVIGNMADVKEVDMICAFALGCEKR
jgi:hypothetical protein